MTKQQTKELLPAKGKKMRLLVELTNEYGETKISFYKEDGKLVIRSEEDFSASMTIATNDYEVDFEEFILNIEKIKG